MREEKSTDGLGKNMNSTVLQYSNKQIRDMQRIDTRSFLQYNQLDALISQIYSWNETLHVLDSSSVHHQEFFSLYTQQ